MLRFDCSPQSRKTSEVIHLPVAGETWLIVEGGKDAAALLNLGFNAAGLPTKEMSVKYARLFRAVHVVIIPDRDGSGEEGAQKTAARLFGVAASVHIATLPAEFKETDGDDVRDVLAKQDGEQLLRQAIADAVPWEAAVESAELITNGQTETDAEGKRFVVPLSMTELLTNIRRRTDGWPRRVDDVLFIHEGDEIKWFDRRASQLFGWLQDKTGVRWHDSTGCVTKGELYDRLRQTTAKYLAVENVPHEPPLGGHYYATPDIEPGKGNTLRNLLDRFCPETDIDRDLIQAALMTLLWGGNLSCGKQSVGSLVHNPRLDRHRAFRHIITQNSTCH